MQGASSQEALTLAKKASVGQKPTSERTWKPFSTFDKYFIPQLLNRPPVFESLEMALGVTKRLHRPKA